MKVRANISKPIWHQDIALHSSVVLTMFGRFAFDVIFDKARTKSWRWQICLLIHVGALLGGYFGVACQNTKDDNWTAEAIYVACLYRRVNSNCLLRHGAPTESLTSLGRSHHYARFSVWLFIANGSIICILWSKMRMKIMLINSMECPYSGIARS